MKVDEPHLRRQEAVGRRIRLRLRVVDEPSAPTVSRISAQDAQGREDDRASRRRVAHVHQERRRSHLGRPCGIATTSRASPGDEPGHGDQGRHGSELCVDVHDDGIWVSDDAAGSVTHLDPSANVIATIKAGVKPSDGTRGPDGVERIPNHRRRHDHPDRPRTDKVVDTIPVVGGPFVARTAFRSGVGRRLPRDAALADHALTVRQRGRAPVPPELYGSTAGSDP